MAMGKLQQAGPPFLVLKLKLINILLLSFCSSGWSSSRNCRIRQ